MISSGIGGNYTITLPASVTASSTRVGGVAEQHFVVGAAGRNHREAVFRRIDHAIEQHRLLHVDHLADLLVELARMRAADAVRVIGLGELDEIRQRFGVGMRVAPAVQQFLPLAHHAHILVVEDEDLDRQVVLHRRRNFLHGHQHRSLAGDIDDERIRMRELHADRGRQSVAHGAEAARGHPAVRLLEMVELRRPHLMLADFGRDVGVAVLGQLVEPLDGVLRLDDLVRVAEGERILRPPGSDLLPPGLQRLLVGHDALARHSRTMSSSTCAQSPTMARSTLTFLLIEDGSMSMWIFFEPGEKASSRPVMRSSKRAPTAIIRSQSCIDQLASQVPCMPSMPSHCRSAAGKGAEPHQRRGDGKAGELDQFAQQIARGAAGIDHAAAGIEQRPLGGRHHVDGLLDLVEVALDLRPIAAVLEFLRLGIGALGELDVLRDIDHDRARPPAGGDMERLVQRARQVGDVLHQIIVFGAGPGDADRVAFLEGVVADEMGRHLPGDDDERDRIAQRVGQAR